MSAVCTRLLIDRTAERACETPSLFKRIAFHDLVADDDDGALCRQHSLDEGVQRLRGRRHSGVDARSMSKIYASFRIENVARERDEYRSGRRRSRYLGR